MSQTRSDSGIFDFIEIDHNLQNYESERDFCLKDSIKFAFFWCFGDTRRVNSSAYIIAEIGVNHNGDLNLAKKLVEEAKRMGADAAKFQTFTAESLVGENVPKVPYQMDTTDHGESHFDMIKKLELSRPDHKKLFDYCAKIGIDFLSTPYDVDSAKFLSELGVVAFKTASADLIDCDLHEYLSSTGKPVYVSVGMATLDEIEKTLQIYDGKNARKLVTLLHCVSNYPCRPESLNLAVLPVLKSTFGTEIGYSDHSEGFLAACISRAFGAKVFEKHFTMDRSLPGPDHKASADLIEFSEWVSKIRQTEVMLGSPIKKIQDEEMDMRKVSRKSLTLSRTLPAGSIVEAKDLILKRPGTGVAGEFRSYFVGKRTRQELRANTMIRKEDVESK
jgi:N,N'-diacetyllegionaminate synthase